MGCCCDKNQVTPSDTPVKKRPNGFFKEKEITDSSKPNTGDLNNNNVAKKPYRPPVKKRKLKQ